jgi:caffeoyl-CoA O-methyltransferase
LAALVHRTQTEDWKQRSANGETIQPLEQEMLSGHVEGQVLKFFVHLTQAKRVLEIGMFTGYSALAIAEALPPDGQIVACEVDPFAAAIAQACFDRSPDGHKILVKIAPAMVTLRYLADAGETFDLVFIDADKAGYIDYLNILLEGSLLANNGLICVDNTLMQGQPYLNGEATPNGTAIAAFNQAVVNDPRVEQVLLPLRDGLTLIRRV